MAEEKDDKKQEAAPEQAAPEGAKAEVKPAASEASEVKPSDAKEDAKPVAEKRSAFDEDEAPAPAPRKVKGAKNVPYGIVHIRATFNNTIVSITDQKGGVISWSSAGRNGFKGSRKSTAFAATVVSQEAARVAVSHGMREVEVRVQGPGAGRESAIRAVQAAGLIVTSIKDVTPIPHNGCRPRKRRRV